jgi:SAM-dependent methyltransferase
MSLFYASTLRKLDLPRDASILAVCGGASDREALLECGYSAVTISNLDERMRGDEFAPYAWSFQDAESLSFPDDSFDYCVVHCGLHHCASPHRGLLEMYRVARRGVLICEARDSTFMRMAIALKWVPDYELNAVRANSHRWGGVRNSCVPNFVYRWTEREVEKTVASFAPYAPPQIRFFYGLRVPTERLPFHSSRSLGWIPAALETAIGLFTRVFPKQGNNFAFYIQKPDDASLFPWLKSRTEFNDQYRSTKALDSWS